MKNRNALIAAVVAVFAIASLPLTAQGQEINNRLKNQNKRITQGVKNGRLTGNQVKKLRGADQRIHAREKFDRSQDKGKLTSAEKRNLNRSLNKNSNKIYRDKHDAASRGN